MRAAANFRAADVFADQAEDGHLATTGAPARDMIVLLEGVEAEGVRESRAPVNAFPPLTQRGAGTAIRIAGRRIRAGRLTAQPGS